MLSAELALKETPVLDRSGFIGGSDAAAVLGLSRWRTPLEVWAEKTGQIVPEDISDRLPVKLGNMMEPIVAELFMQETGFKVRRVNQAITHNEYPFLAAHIDRRVVGDDSILECKTTSAWKSKEWLADEIPHEYIIQVMHYLAVTGMRKAYIAVLIGNEKFIWKEINRDEELISDLLSREVEFWKRFVLPKVMPSQITKHDSDVLFGLYPEAKTGSHITLGDDADKLIEMRNALYQDEINIEGQRERIENEIKALLGSCEEGLSSRYRVTWKNQSRTSFDSKKFKTDNPTVYAQYARTSEFRKLDIKEANRG